MNEDDLLARLKDEIARDLTPVQPLHAPGVRALWLLGAWVTLGGLVWFVAGPRPDVGALGLWRSVGLSLAQVGLCVMLFGTALRLSVPAMARPRSWALAMAAVAVAAQVVVNGITLDASASAPAAGRERAIGFACLGAITVLSAGPVAAGALMLSRGLLTRPLPAVLLVGLACGLAAEATWRLHCEYSDWSHILPFHTGALVPTLFLAWGALMAVRHYHGSRPGRHRGAR